MKILVVDPGEQSARGIADAIAADGLGEAFLATNAEEAVAVANAQDGVDVLVTEIFLPDLDGFDLFAAMAASLPELKAVFLAEQDPGDIAARAAGWPVRIKPVPAEDVVAEISRVAPVGDPFVGNVVGDFRIEARLGDDADGPIYQAVQTSIGRAVELHLLAPERLARDGEAERFLACARAKASAHHPALLSVFEAGEAEGWYFYASETRQGESLEQLAARGARLDAATILALLHVVAEVMIHLGHARIAHDPVTPAAVIVDRRNHARVVNLATHEPGPNAFRDEMHGLAAALRSVAPDEPSAAALHRLLANMAGDAMTVRSWAALLFEVKRCEQGGMPAATVRMDAGGRAAVEAVGAARRRMRWIALARNAAIVLALIAAGTFAWWYFRGERLGNPELERMIAIPAGPLLLQGESPVTVPAFWIDQYEVSIGQYADFLSFVRRHPGEAKLYLPEESPADHSFVPQGWAAVDGRPGYFAIAKAGGEYDGARLTLDSPVFGVDWRSAYAYALWKKRRLPTEEEWERAAGGERSRSFPWGDEAKPGGANLAGNDPFPKWSPVNAGNEDRTPEGVAGLGGNVSEWTQTVIKVGPAEQPIVRGGNWSNADLDLRRRTLGVDIGAKSPTVGFRTASSSPPTP